MANEQRPIVIGITGASGAVYARRLLEFLLEAGHSVHLAISTSGATVWHHELGDRLAPGRLEPDQLGLRVEPSRLDQLHCFSASDYLAPMASGSFLTAGMVICPCSGATLGAIAHGTSSNLIQRAADVQLKERRRLIVVPRETPLSVVHLDNMKRVCEAGAVVLPAMPGWYHGVSRVEDLIDFIVARILDQLELDHALFARWGSLDTGAVD